MSKRPRGKLANQFENLSGRVTKWTGSTPAFACALGIVAAWGLLGPVFHYSDTWQLVINTGTTVVTFLMVFLIQRSQNKDALAIHLKLNELVAAIEGASNRLIDVEALSEKELHVVHNHFVELARLSREELNTTQSHSVEEAEQRHRRKTRATK
jgi:low affinity Fe/Cu permease